MQSFYQPDPEKEREARRRRREERRAKMENGDPNAGWVKHNDALARDRELSAQVEELLGEFRAWLETTNEGRFAEWDAEHGRETS